jgi:diguanylate cyclase (GGDEF)-like protein
MVPPQTYRNRLILYIVLLEAFLIGVLFYFYSQSRDAILDTANRNIGLFVAEVEGKIKLEELELQQSARLISNNVQLQEYMFVVVNLGTDTQPLADMFQRQFGWLPYRQAAIISREGRVLIGSPDPQLVKRAHAPSRETRPLDELFHINTGNGVEMVVTVPVVYQDRYLGKVVLTRVVDARLIAASRKAGYGQIFVVNDGLILRSSLEEGLSGRTFKPNNGEMRLGHERYLVRRIEYAGRNRNVPEVWFGFSNPELTGRLDKNRFQMLALAIGGSLAILILGVAMIRNFSRPIGRLVMVMRDVGEGRFPDIRNRQSNDEIGYLISQFQAMVTRLREKQDEVDRIHSQLEEQATTDALTGLYNRRHLYDLYPKLSADAERRGKTLTVIIADLDFFKEINDQYGHVNGDKVLTQFSTNMQECCRVSDFVFRIGGEEFLILTTGGVAGGEILAEKIRKVTEERTVPIGNEILSVTASFGVAQAEPGETDVGLSEVLTRADRALYAAKEGGRNRVATWDLRRMRA